MVGLLKSRFKGNMVLQEFLAFCKGALEKLCDFPAVHVVMSNEACDLDSAVSAVTYAFYLHEISMAALGTVIFLPILNLKREDFRLRTEIGYYFGKHTISEDDLIFIDDIDLLKLKDITDLKVTLVDHHVLPSWLSALEDNVVQIIDHRPQDGSLPDRCQECILELVGSCCTLVAEALLSDVTFSMDWTVASLLFGTIVTDTINFSPLAGKSTPKDEQIAEQLEMFVHPRVERDALFNEISKAKFNLSGLTTEEILRKDMKIVSGDSLKVAMSSITADMNSILERSDFEESVRKFAGDRGVDAVVILTAQVTEDGSVQRQLGIFSPSRVYREQMADVLQACSAPNLELSPLACKHEDFLAFYQGNFRASRKQILPIIKGFLAGETTPDENQADAFSDIPKLCPEGFTSMTSIIVSCQETSEGDITPEDLTSCDDLSEMDASDELSKLQERKVFDPLSSVHSSDSISSPSDFTVDERIVSVDNREEKPGTSNAKDDLVIDRNWNRPGVVSFERFSFPVGNTHSDLSASGSATFGEASKLFGDNNTSVLATDIVLGEPLSSVPALSVPTSVASGQVGIQMDVPLLDGAGSELLEHDILAMTCPHDLLLQDTPPELSPAVLSGQTSGHESKASSYPVTPPNSYVEFDFSLVPQEVHLPICNSLEMVESVQGNKAALNEGEEPGLLGAVSPFTPQNSYSGSAVESSFAPDFFKETSLPSFHSSDMVQRIQEKRTSMERELGLGAEGENLLDAMKSPFTPPNSFVEGGFDSFAREHLPSLNSAEISNKIRQKQAELGSMCNDDTEVHSVSPAGLSMPGTDSAGSPSHPYTPQNSYKDSALGSPGHRGRVTDLYEVAERLSLTESESSGSSNNLKASRTNNRVEFRDQDDDVDSLFVGDEAQDYRAPFGRRVSNSVGAGFPGISQGTEKGGTLQQQASNGSQSASDVEEEQRGEDELEDDEALKEIAVQKIAFELANEMIQKALETFPSESVSKLVPATAPTVFVKHPSISDDSPPTVDNFDSDASMTESMTAELVSGRLEPDLSDREASADEDGSSRTEQKPQVSSSVTGSAGGPTAASSETLLSELAAALEKSEVQESCGYLRKRQSIENSLTGYSSSEQSISSMKDDSVKDCGTYAIETEYLHELDPMQKGLYQREATVIETDADKEVAEASSFRKISGQEYQTVQEDILEQIRQEARDKERIKWRQSSVAEELEDVDKASKPLHAATGEAHLKWDTQGERNPKADDRREKDVDDNVESESSQQEVEAKRDKEINMEAMDCQNDPKVRTTGWDESDTKPIEDFSSKIDWSTEASSADGSGSKNSEKFPSLDESELAGGMLATSSPYRQPSGDVGANQHSRLEDLKQQCEEEKETYVRRVVHPEVDVSLDESMTGEQGKKTIHVERDRELYVSALNNIEVECEDFAEGNMTVVDESGGADQKLDDSLEIKQEVVKRKIGVDMLDNSSFVDYQKQELKSFSRSEEASMLRLEEDCEMPDERAEIQEQEISAVDAIAQTVSTEANKSGCQKKEVPVSWIAPKPQQEQFREMELKDEWQDDELPNIIGEGHVIAEKQESQKETGEDLRRKLVPAVGLVSDNHLDDTEVLDSDSEIDSNMDNDQLEWENDTPVRMADRTTEIPEYTAEEERRDAKSWKLVQIADMEFRIDMRVIEPYKRVLSHGGYYGESLNAIIVFSGCYLPSKDRKDYSYVMDHLFYYVIHTLDELVADDYMIVYFHGATPRKQMPSFGWLKKCYQSIDRKLKKNLKALFLVHPTLWLKTIVLMTRPFISSKFSSKLQFVRSLDDLRKLIPMEYVYIPEQVQSCWFGGCSSTLTMGDA